LTREDSVVEGALLAKHFENTTKIKTKAKVKRKITHLVNIVEKWVTGSDHMQSAISAIRLNIKL